MNLPDIYQPRGPNLRVFWLTIVAIIVMATLTTFAPVEGQTRYGAVPPASGLRRQPTNHELALAVRSLENKVKRLERRVKSLERR